MFCWKCTIFSALLSSMSLQCSCSASQCRKWSSSLRWQKTHSGFNNSSLAVIFHLGDRIKHHVNCLGISRSQHILRIVSSQCKPVSPQVFLFFFFFFAWTLHSTHKHLSVQLHQFWQRKALLWLYPTANKHFSVQAHQFWQNKHFYGHTWLHTNTFSVNS